MKASKAKIAVHVICCLLFLSMPYAFAPGRIDSLDSAFNLFRLREFIAYLLLIVVFYLNYLWLIPSLYFNQKFFQFFSIALVLFLLVGMLPNIFIQQDIGYSNHDHMQATPTGIYRNLPLWLSPFEIFHNLFLYLVVLFISLTLKINDRLKQTEKEKVAAELAFLKAQINPHFMFNTLNSIYSLAIENSEYTATAVVKLSGLMRYIITDAENDFVSLAQEISYISDYIELQRVRFDNTFKLNYQVRGNPHGKKITPLLILPFVENAFKYGVNPEEDSEISIAIDVTDEELVLVVWNKKVKHHKKISESSGLGIANTRNRLQLLYPGKHKFEILDRPEYFSVNLSIKLI